jgi:glycosyltransferase involved in cell wall biosynthesis
MDGRLRQVPPSRRERWIRTVRPFWADAAPLRRAIVQAARRADVELIHVHWSSVIGRAASAAARVLDLPFVAEVRFDLAGGIMSESLPFENSWIERGLRRWNEQHLASADAVIAASHSLGALLQAEFPEARPVTVIPNAIDTQTFRPGPPPIDLRQQLGLDDKLILGSTGSMYRYEGFDVLIDVLTSLREARPDLHGLLIGDGPRRAALERRARRAGAPVTFHGPVPREAIPAYYRLFDLFVVPRRDTAVTRHASPLKLLEAMASGCPCMASPVGDIRHMLSDGRGVLVRAEDRSAWRTAITDLAEAPAERAALGRKARAWAQHRPSWDTAAAHHAGLYAKLLSSTRPNA